MRKNTFLLTACLVTLLGCFACVPDTVKPNATNYSPLTKGSFWIYQYFNKQYNGPLILENLYDSTYVSRDTVIRGDTFRIVVNYGYRLPKRDSAVYTNYAILRDSAGYVINDRGDRSFFPDTRTDVLRRDTIKDFAAGGRNLAIIEYVFDNRDTLVTVPAGTFKSINFKSNFDFQAPYSSDCKGCEGTKRSSSAFYSKGVGKVKDVYFGDYRDGTNYGRQLVRYTLK
jgi:hypothetical protein